MKICGFFFPRIKKISWIHDKEYTSFEEFKETLQRLEISFTKDIVKESINHKTLSLSLLTYSFTEKDGKYTEILIQKRELPIGFIKKENKKVVFGVIEISPTESPTAPSDPSAIISPPSGVSKAGFRAIIRLNGDFVIGKNGKCLDGNHLKGVLPSGNGCEGGEFVSWFDIKLEVNPPP